MQDDKKKAKKLKKPGCTSLLRAIHQTVSACIPLFHPFVLPKSVLLLNEENGEESKERGNGAFLATFLFA